MKSFIKKDKVIRKKVVKKKSKLKKNKIKKKSKPILAEFKVLLKFSIYITKKNLSEDL